MISEDLDEKTTATYWIPKNIISEKDTAKKAAKELVKQNWPDYSEREIFNEPKVKAYAKNEDTQWKITIDINLDSVSL